MTSLLSNLYFLKGLDNKNTLISLKNYNCIQKLRAKSFCLEMNTGALSHV